MIKLYDKILLKTGQKAVITEILEQNKMYVGEISSQDGDIEIDFITSEQIAEIN